MMRMITAIDGAAMRLGYASPRARGHATEDQLLLLDSMESGLARASMSMHGSGRLAALLRVEGPEIGEAELVATLAALRDRHPLLRRSLRRTGLGLALAPCSVAPQVVVSFSDEAEAWREAWRAIEAVPLREGSPLLSVYVLKQKSDPRVADVLLVIEHIISDGASLVSLGKEMLEILSLVEPRSDSESTSLEPFPPSVVTMAAERVGGTIRGLARMARAAASFAARDRDEPHVRLPRASGARVDEGHTHVAFRDLEPAFYDELFARARAEKVSVAATVVAALSLAFAEYERGERGDRGVYRVQPHVTVDLRSRYARRVAHRDLGVHIATVDPCVSIAADSLADASDRSLFATARVVRGEMQELLRTGVDRHFLSALVAGVGMLVPRLAPERSLGTFVFTDASAFAVPARLGDFDVRGAAALANCRGQTLPYVVTTRSAANVRISMMAPTPAFAAEDVDAVLDVTVARLARAIGRSA